MIYLNEIIYIYQNWKGTRMQTVKFPISGQFHRCPYLTCLFKKKKKSVLFNILIGNPHSTSGNLVRVILCLLVISNKLNIYWTSRKSMVYLLFGLIFTLSANQIFFITLYTKWFAHVHKCLRYFLAFFSLFILPLE